MLRLRFHTRLASALALAASVGCVTPRVPLPSAADRTAAYALPLPTGLEHAAQSLPVEEGRSNPSLQPTRHVAPPRESNSVVAADVMDALPADFLTLDQLEHLAQSHNPILQRDLAKLDSARGQALQAGLYPNPRFDTNNPEVFAGRNTLLNFGIQQEIVTKGKLRLDTAAAQQEDRKAELRYNQNRLALPTDVRKQ